jgi:hypothetical protein
LLRITDDPAIARVRQLHRRVMPRLKPIWLRGRPFLDSSAAGPIARAETGETGV